MSRISHRLHILSEATNSRLRGAPTQQTGFSGPPHRLRLLTVTTVRLRRRLTLFQGQTLRPAPAAWVLCRGRGRCYRSVSPDASSTSISCDEKVSVFFLSSKWSLYVALEATNILLSRPGHEPQGPNLQVPIEMFLPCCLLIYCQIEATFWCLNMMWRMALALEFLLSGRLRPQSRDWIWREEWHWSFFYLAPFVCLGMIVVCMEFLT